MTKTQVAELAALNESVGRADRDAAWIARRLGKNYQWVRRRLRGITPLSPGDRELIESALRTN
ncbi:hypothetical protein GCM10010471_00600 [Leucobacter komagatae]